jgi:membrane-bound lytic murein transglycosylase MltF
VVVTGPASPALDTLEDLSGQVVFVRPSSSYFASLTRLNGKALFAFACYNAGPVRIARLRTEAAADGLDPNRWFGQVERVAARRIGQETVRYVRDIYKYYVAYKLAEKSRAHRERIKREVGGPAAPR